MPGRPLPAEGAGVSLDSGNLRSALGAGRNATSLANECGAYESEVANEYGANASWEIRTTLCDVDWIESFGCLDQSPLPSILKRYASCCSNKFSNLLHNSCEIDTASALKSLQVVSEG